MTFGIGGSTSKSSSSSSSFDSSSSISGSEGFGKSSSEQSIAFEDIFARLFGGAEGVAGGLDPSMLTDAANQLFNSGSAFLQGIGNDQGTQFLQDRLSGENQVLEDQINLLGQDLSNFFNEELLPGITSKAVDGGQLGGGRQGVAQGKAISEVGKQFTRGSVALRSADITARDNAAATLSGNSISGASVGLGGLGPLEGVADLGFSAGIAPYERLAAILGGPTVLSSSSSSSADWARALSQSYGESTAKSKSSSKSLSVGF